INDDDAPAIIALTLVRTVRRRHQAAITLGFRLFPIDRILQVFRPEQRCADLDLRAVDPLATPGFLALNKSQHHAEGARYSTHEVGMLGSWLRRRRSGIGIVP